MPVNEFEKQVQQKMDELQLRPSAQVWEEVEMRIRKEKKRRGIILWFFILAVLLLGGTGWLFISGNKKQSLTNNSEKHTTATNKRINEIKDTSANESEVTTKISADSISLNEKEKTQTDKIIVAEKKNTLTEISRTDLSTERKYTRKEKKINSTEKDIAAHPNKTKDSFNRTETINNDDQPLKTKEAIVVTDEEVVKKNIETSSVKTDSSVAIISAESKINNTDSASEQVAMKKVDSLNIKMEDKIAKTDTGKKKKNKWEFGINAMGGVSNKVDGFSFGQKKDLGTLQNASPGGGVVTAPVLTPAAPTSGFMWQAGVYAKRSLTGKTSLSAGLNFSSYAIKQTTGILIDSARNFSSQLSSSYVSRYYISGTSGTSHANHYYFLEVPVSFHWQLNKGNKLPIIWQNGFSTGVYIGGDALVYNSASNVFYKDKKSFNKVQLAFQSGLYTKLFTRKTTPVTVGLLFNYQLSKLQKENIIGGNHLSSFGIQIGWLLKK